MKAHYGGRGRRGLKCSFTYKNLMILWKSRFWCLRSVRGSKVLHFWQVPNSSWFAHTWSKEELRKFAVVQSLSHVRLFATPWTAACQAYLSFTISRSLLQLMSIESVMASNHLILCCLLLLLPSIFPSIRVFSNESILCIIWFGQSVGVSASASVLPINIQDWSPLGWTGWISLQSKGLSRVFSNTTV